MTYLTVVILNLYPSGMFAIAVNHVNFEISSLLTELKEIEVKPTYFNNKTMFTKVLF